MGTAPVSSTYPGMALAAICLGLGACGMGGGSASTTTTQTPSAPHVTPTTTPYDLVALGAYATPDQPVTGDFVLHFTVYNSAPDNHGALNIGWRILQDGQPLPSSAGEVSGTIPSLQGNQAVDIAARLDGVSAGSHTFTAEVDPDDSHAEASETNNTDSVTATISTPASAPPGDLFVSGAYLSDPNAASLAVTFSIVDVGDAGTSAANVAWKLQFDGADLPAGSGEDQGTVASIPANGQTTVTAHLLNVAPGAHTVTVLVDPANAVPESSESNNSDTFSATVVSSGSPASDVDLFVVGYHTHEPIKDSASPDYGMYPKDMQVHFWVYNASPSGRDVTNVRYRILLDGGAWPAGYPHGQFTGVFPVVHANTSGSGIDKGEFLANLQNVPNGTHTLTLVIDADSTVDETREDNNSADLPPITIIPWAGG